MTTTMPQPSVIQVGRPLLPDNGITPPFHVRDYQWQGALMLYQGQRRALHDAPRLGKTTQALLAAVPPVLIAAPAYLVGHWYDTLLSHGVSVGDIALAVGSRYDRQWMLSQGRPWTICNIEMLRKTPNPRNRYVFRVPHTFIVDEAHHLRGRSSQQSAGAYDIAVARGYNGWNAAKRVYLLTGTPVKNLPDDLYAQLRLLDPQRFTSYWAFIKQYCKVYDAGFGPRVVAVKKDNDAFYKPLHDMLQRYALGRTQAEAGLDLSKLTSQVLHIDGDDAFTRLYKQLKREYVDWAGRQADSLMEVFIKLRQMTVPLKLKALLQLLTDASLGRDIGGAGTVVFCKYKRTAEAVANATGATLITGDMPPAERARKAMLDDMIVATIDSLGEGIDLSHLPVTVFMEADYQPGVMQQALARNALAKQARHVYYLLVRNTVDDVIHRAHTARGADIRAILQQEMAS